VRALVIAGEFPPMQGGVGDFSRCLAESLSRQGLEVSVFSPVGSISGSTFTFTVLGVARGWGWQDLWRIVQRCRQGIDVVNLQYQAAAYAMRLPIHLLPWACRWCGIPLVVTFHDLRLPYLFPKAGKLRARVIEWLLSGCDAAIVTNEEDAEKARAMAPEVPLRVVRIGSNVKPAARDGGERKRLRERWGVGEESVVLCYFGFLNGSKGAGDLVRALALLRERDEDVYLVFIGGLTGDSDVTNARSAAEVSELAQRLHVEDRVRYTGFVCEAEVSAAFYASDICVLPYRDGASYRRGSLMAALAHGMPIVTTIPRVHVPGLSEGSNVALVPEGKVELLAERIAALADDAEERERLSRAAKDLARQFDWDAIARDTIAVYQEAMQRHL